MSAVAPSGLSAAELEARLGCRLPQHSAEGRARSAALMADSWADRQPTSLVAYHSRGRVAIIAGREQGEALAARLAPRVTCTLLIPVSGAEASADAPAASDGHAPSAPRRIRAHLAGVSGYLGQFSVKGLVKGEEVDIAPSLLTAHQPFDIVLDLGRPAQLERETLPPGYYAPGDDAEALEKALEEIPDLVGEFEKPRYFDYNPDICAHGASGIGACTRCLDACPTLAISSVGERIEVNPYLCQGGGSCATACPSGAITYAFPIARDLLASLRTVLQTYLAAGDENGAALGAPRVLFHDGESGRAWLAAHAEALPENVIPCEVEEIGSVGMDIWLAALAWGAAEVCLLLAPGTPASVRRELTSQQGFAGAILAGMGYDAALVRLVDAGDGEALAATRADTPCRPATFQGQNDKRTNIRLAAEHLYEQAPVPAESAPLPAGAPFGELVIDKQACTLCMACVGVCPVSALADGGAEPKLKFVEWNCVQCGLCEAACPEDAIRRQARFIYDPRLRREQRVLNEDQPFHCISCGKPFATTRVIESMRDKLKEHWMFQKPEAVKRLEMCDDCRVRDVFKDGGGMLDGFDER